MRRLILKNTCRAHCAENPSLNLTASCCDVTDPGTQDSNVNYSLCSCLVHCTELIPVHLLSEKRQNPTVRSLYKSLLVPLHAAQMCQVWLGGWSYLLKFFPLLLNQIDKAVTPNASQFISHTSLTHHQCRIHRFDATLRKCTDVPRCITIALSLQIRNQPCVSDIPVKDCGHRSGSSAGR